MHRAHGSAGKGFLEAEKNGAPNVGAGGVPAAGLPFGGGPVDSSSDFGADGPSPSLLGKSRTALSILMEINEDSLPSPTATAKTAAQERNPTCGRTRSQ